MWLIELKEWDVEEPQRIVSVRWAQAWRSLEGNAHNQLLCKFMSLCSNYVFAGTWNKAVGSFLTQTLEFSLVYFNQLY